MAINSTSVLTQELFDAIDEELLLKPDDQFVFNEQLVVQEKTDIPPGAKTVNFDLFAWTGGTFTEASRRLTEGTAITATPISLSESQKTLTIREYGGPHDATNVAPFGLTNLLKKLAKHDVAAVIGEQLRRDRYKWENMVKMNLMLTSTNVVTPDGSAEGAITVSQAASAAWLRALNKKMKDTLVPRFPNGRWKLIIGTKQESELKNDSDIKAALREFSQANPIITSGQVGVYEGFDIFVDTLLPTKGVGAASAVTGYQAVAFGPYSLGHGTVEGVAAAMKDDTDYGRQSHVIWKAIECWGELYLDLCVRGITT